MSGVFEESTVPAKIIANESIRLKKLVEQMITLSRLDSMGQAPMIESIEMFYFFNQIVERFEGFVNKESIQLEVICKKNARFLADEEMKNLFERHQKSVSCMAIGITFQIDSTRRLS